MAINMFLRKIDEIGSFLYRTFLFPFVRMKIEIKTKSIMKQKSYIKNSRLCGKNYIGKKVYLNNTEVGYGSYINDNGNFTNTQIGKYTSIGTGCCSVIGRHPIEKQVAMHPAFYSKDASMGFSYTKTTTFEEFQFLSSKDHIQIVIGNDVWIGNDVRILEGVTIGDGAVVGTGAVVTKNLEPYSINVGIPAKPIKYRFSKDKIDKLLANPWWEKSEEFMKEHIQEFSDIEHLTFI